MIKVIAFLACLTILSGNIVNYAYQMESKMPLIPDLLNKESLYEFYLPTIDTVILRFNNSVRMVNTIQPELYTEYTLPTSAIFTYGQQLSLITSNELTLAIKSYQYPQMRIFNAIYPKSTTSIIWINQTTALTTVLASSNAYIGVYCSSDTLDYIPTLYTGSKFKGAIKILGNEVLMVQQREIFKYDLSEFTTTQILYNSSYAFQPQCVKVFSLRDQANNKIYEYLAIKQDRLIHKYTRELQLDGDNIISKTQFVLGNSFVDTSYNCSFDFLNQKQLILANQTASVVYRGIDIEDFFIGSRSSKLASNSIPIRGTSASFIKDAVIQTIQPSTLQITSRKVNMTLQNEVKVWQNSQQQIIIFNNEQKVEIQRGVDGISTLLTGILDCELIADYLFLLKPASGKLELVVYEISSKKQLSSQAIDNSSISEIKLEGVKINGHPICMLSYRQKNDNVVNQFWDFQPSVGLQKAINDTHTPYNKILIPTSTTYYLVEDKGDIRTTISFYSLTDNTPKYSIRDVLNYKWLKVQETALVVYFGNERKQGLVYLFKIDLQANTVTIQSETFIQFSNMSDDIPSSSVFFLPEIRTNHQPNNNLIYFYSSVSYFYNTVDPVSHYSQIKRFPFNTLNEALLINPQFNRENLYYALPNFTFVQIKYQPAPQPEITNDCNFKSLFEKCRSVRMKIINQDTRAVISFLCNTDLNSIIYFYDASTIMTCNIHNRLNRLIYPLGVVDFDINSMNEVVVVHTKGEEEYLDYYKDEPRQLIAKPICLSDNGYFMGYIKDNSFIIYNILTGIDYNSQINVLQTIKCTIDNSGTWYVLYNINDYIFTLRNLNIPIKKIKLNYPVQKIEFIGLGILIKTSNDLYYYDHILKDNVRYLSRKNSISSVTSTSYSGSCLAFTLTKSTYDVSITVCEFNGICFPSFKASENHFYYKVRSDGKVVVYQDSNRSLQLWSNQIKQCDGGSFISNGECARCSQDCSSCEAQTGACLEWSCGSGWEIGFWITLGFFLIALIVSIILGCMLKKKSKKPKQSLLSGHFNGNGD